MSISAPSQQFFQSGPVKKQLRTSAYRSLLLWKIAVEATVGQTSACHDFLDRDVLKSVAIEQPARAIDDAFPYCVAVSGGIWHVSSSISYIIPKILC